MWSRLPGRLRIVTVLLGLTAIYSLFLINLTLYVARSSEPERLRYELPVAAITGNTTFNLTGSTYNITSALRLSCVVPLLDSRDGDYVTSRLKLRPLECDTNDTEWVRIFNGSFTVTEAAKRMHGKIVCGVIPILPDLANRELTHRGELYDPALRHSRTDTDFMEVRCKAADGATYDNVIASIGFSARMRGHQQQHTMLGLNVIMLGVKSLSRASWQQILPLTHKYMVDRLGGLVFEGYNVMGQGGDDAILPILRRDKAYSSLSQRTLGMPQYTWIWNDLSSQGYVTLVGEDRGKNAILNETVLGRSEMPDHFMRPYQLNAEKLRFRYKPRCDGSVPQHLVMFNWLRDFVEIYAEKPKFSLLFLSEYGEDDKGENSLLDSDLRDLLHDLTTSGHLDNTLLVLFSDHGSRDLTGTHRGFLMERLPYLAIRAPPVIRNKYPQMFQNLQENAGRFTTPYDLYATLRDVAMYPASCGDHAWAPGNSLLRHIPDDRTCIEAGIEPFWCTCLPSVGLPVTDATVQ